MEEELTKMGSLALGIADRAKSEGILEGRREGEKTGEHRVIEAIRMLRENLPSDTIIKKTGMSLQRLTELKAML